MQDSKLHKLASFWLGPKLGVIEQLCIASIKAQGHELTIFGYEPPENLPEWVNFEDIRSIYDPGYIVIHQRTKSPAPHADIVRLYMQAKTDFVWVDLDLLFLKPLVDTGSGYVIGVEDDKGRVGNSILHLPRESEGFIRIVDEIEQFLGTTEHEVLSESFMDERFGVKIPGKSFEMHVAKLGPQILTRILHETGENKFAASKDVFFPIYINNVRSFVQLPAVANIYITEDTVAVHLWGSRLRNAIQKRPPQKVAKCWNGQKCKQYGIDVVSFYDQKEQANAQEPENV